MSSWVELKVKDLAIRLTSGGTPKSSVSDYYNGHIPWLNTKEVKFNRIWTTEKNISENGLMNSSAKWIPANSVIVAMYGATAGNVAQSKIDLTTNQACCNIIIDDSMVNSEFLFYNLWYNNKTLVNLAVGAAQQNLSLGVIGDLKIQLPPLQEQKAIAEVLSSLDDKIELLQKQNETLEALAQTLFRQWFIEEADDSWEEVPLTEIAHFLNGLACQKFPPLNESDKLPVLKIRELKDGISDSSDSATSTVDEKYLVENGDVIFSWSASLVVKIWNGERCVLNQHLFKVTSEKYPKWYYYQWCKYHLNRFIAVANAHATTMGHIKRSDLNSAMVLVPSKNELETMTPIIEPIMGKISFNNDQIRILTETRDTLLPKLMSGQVRVKLD